MTIEEAIEHATEVADSYANTAPDCDCAEDHRQLAEWLTGLKELKQKAEKYRWHDLRKDSEDLPKVDGMYDVLVRDEDGDIWTMTASYSKTVLVTGNRRGWGFRYPYFHINFTLDTVIAWKERDIEPFEEDDTK